MSNPSTPKHVEIFTAGCPLCEPAIALVEKARCPECRVTVHDLTGSCETGSCLERARAFGVERLPAIVVDGEVAGCCQGGIDAPTLTEIVAA